MSLKAGIVGLPNVGKSTLFNAITNSHVEAANYPFATIKPNTGVVTVPDARVDYLSKMFEPKRTIYATFEFYDIAGLVKGASQGEGLGNQFLSHIRECDAIVEVVRCFENPEIIHVENTIDPARDIDIINLELVMADLDSVNKRLAKVITKARVNKDKDSIKEAEILEKLADGLQKGLPARAIDTLNEDQKEFAIASYFLLTMKPIIYVGNVSEEDYAAPEANKYFRQVKEIAEREHAEAIPVSCQIEAELSELPQVERKEYLSSLGANESGLDKVVRASYHLLNLATFFTVGKDEVRAWTFLRGQSAPECAGIIHTDFQRGFIKAEIYSYTDLVHLGSETAVKDAGKLRMEGKDYQMEDGDIVFFRFNI